MAPFDPMLDRSTIFGPAIITQLAIKSGATPPAALC
jgi:hypothetical protein